MSSPRQIRPRIAEVAAAVIVLAIPIALIAATWTPLEPLPSRAGRVNSVEQNRVGDRSVDDPGDEDTEEDKRDRRANRARERERTDSLTVATPRP